MSPAMWRLGTAIWYGPLQATKFQGKSDDPETIGNKHVVQTPVEKAVNRSFSVQTAARPGL